MKKQVANTAKYLHLKALASIFNQVWVDCCFWLVHSELSQGSSSEHPLSHGPVDYPDIFAWPARVLERAKDVYGKALTRRNLATAKKVLLTSTFSGLGTAEVAMAMLAQEYQSGGESCFAIHSHCERDPECLALLEAMPHPLSSAHLFSDVRDLLQRSEKETLQNIVVYHREQFQKRWAQSNVTCGREKQRLQERQEELCLQEVIDFFDSVQLKARVACRKCSSSCPRCPSHLREIGLAQFGNCWLPMCALSDRGIWKRSGMVA